MQAWDTAGKAYRPLAGSNVKNPAVTMAPSHSRT